MKAKVNGRIYVLKEDGYTVVDDSCGSCVSFERRYEANEFAKLCRDFIRLYGDVSLYSAPYDLHPPTDKDLARYKYLNAHMGSEPDADG